MIGKNVLKLITLILVVVCMACCIVLSACSNNDPVITDNIGTSGESGGDDLPAATYRDLYLPDDYVADEDGDLPADRYATATGKNLVDQSNNAEE